jgi:hypothetical protein
MATNIFCDEDPYWNADSPVSEWTRPMIEALANILVKVAREGTDEQRELMRLIGERLVFMTKDPKPRARRRRSTQ